MTDRDYDLGADAVDEITALRQRIAELERGHEAQDTLLKRLEFGIYHRTGGREGRMCGICYRFEREGHDVDCWLGKALVAIRNEKL